MCLIVLEIIYPYPKFLNYPIKMGEASEEEKEAKHGPSVIYDPSTRYQVMLQYLK